MMFALLANVYVMVLYIAQFKGADILVFRSPKNWPILANSSKHYATWHYNLTKPLISSHIYGIGHMAFANISQN